MSFSDLSTVVPAALRDHFAPGAAVAAVDRSGELFISGFGTCDIEGKLPVGPDTRFGMASISKTMTAIVAGTLVHEGALQWDAPVRSVLPHFRLPDPMATERCTLRDLFLHRSGLPAGDTLWWRRELSEDQAIALLPDVPSGKEFRTAWQYQNLNYAVIAAMMRAATGRSWHQLMADRLFGPLGMTTASTTLTGLTADDNYARAAGPNGLFPPRPVPFLNLYGLSAAGAINCSVRDLGRYCRMMLNSGGESIPKPVVTACTTPHLVLEPQVWPELLFWSQGLAWFVQVYRGEICWSASGGMDGYVSHCYLLPGRGVAGAALANRSGANLAQPLALEVLDRAAGFPTIPWCQRFLEQKRGFRAAATERQKARRARLADKPARPLADYAGLYTHPAGGEARVELADGALRFRYYSIDARALPYGGDNFGLLDADDATELDIEFAGPNPDTLTFRLFAAVPPVTFRRQGNRL